MGIDDVAQPKKQYEIFLVEDESSVRDVTSRLLGKFGHKVYAFEDAKSALDALKLKKPNLLISDIRLYGLNGFELYHLATQIYPDLQILFSTGSYHGLNFDDLIRGTTLTKENFVPKPLEINRLKERVRYFCEKSEEKK